MAVSVNVQPQNVELMEPGHIVISDNSSPRPFIWQSSKDLTFSKFPDLVENFQEPLLNSFDSAPFIRRIYSIYWNYGGINATGVIPLFVVVINNKQMEYIEQNRCYRVSVRRQVACYLTERRTGRNTTDKFTSHTAYTVNLQNSVACPQHLLIYTSHWTNLLNFTCLVVYTLTALCLTFKLVWLIYSWQFQKYLYLETLHHT